MSDTEVRTVPLVDGHGEVRQILVRSLQEFVVEHGRDVELDVQRTKMRELVSVKLAKTKDGDVWTVTEGWAAATENGIPDMKEKKNTIRDLPSPEWEEAWVDICVDALKEAGLDSPKNSGVLLEFQVGGGVPKFTVEIRRISSGSYGLQGKGKVAFALNPSKKLAEKLLRLRKMAFRLADGGERAQTVIKLDDRRKEPETASANGAEGSSEGPKAE